jgi:hypothetical protein
MGFNKRYFSKETIRRRADSCTEHYEFYMYFRVDAAICRDEYSEKILKEIRKYKITDKEKILKILNKCKTKNKQNKVILFLKKLKLWT